MSERCPTCSADLHEDDLCAHRNPLCLPCCLTGEHNWIERPFWRDDRDGAA